MRKAIIADLPQIGELFDKEILIVAVKMRDKVTKFVTHKSLENF